MTSHYDNAIHRISRKTPTETIREMRWERVLMLQKPHLLRKLAEIWCLCAVEDDETVRFSGCVCVCCGTCLLVAESE